MVDFNFIGLILPAFSATTILRATAVLQRVIGLAKSSAVRLPGYLDIFSSLTLQYGAHCTNFNVTGAKKLPSSFIYRIKVTKH